MKARNSTPLEHRIKAENYAVLHDVPDRAQMSDNGQGRILAKCFTSKRGRGCMPASREIC
jgi:hypothetical protein